MASRLTQGEIDNKVMRMMTRAFVLANYHLSGHDQQYARELYGAMASAYRYGPMINRQITACLICTSSDTFQATATAIDMLLCAVLRAPAGEPPYMIVNATTPPTMPTVACFLVMLDDARMQATYEHITSLAAPNARYSVPTPFYTTPFVAGAATSAWATPTQATTTTATATAASAASTSTSAWRTMEEDNWTDAGTMAVLNRVWGYWIARLGYPTQE
ncbi:uncharacterized protein LTHEOB_5927 [Lasiodiplodia theobromae]|uniref:Uncharacterized protein n=1 Tax=Lasiodiplodia theobromae TaxID=45133 RepID=A0A5N5D316_9PEZI|nr:uncharacterized protein LTHEOB_5927 [Lasiodiplodia theobromae]KAB2572069.1 hypothetical protein DBV05_g9293 [Lasiodiplodia theobromae]KAF4544918.1 hypothetical protein LTHEOB_5927 [Lasiodiplodia theobromae]